MKENRRWLGEYRGAIVEYNSRRSRTVSLGWLAGRPAVGWLVGRSVGRLARSKRSPGILTNALGLINHADAGSDQSNSPVSYQQPIGAPLERTWTSNESRVPEITCPTLNSDDWWAVAVPTYRMLLVHALLSRPPFSLSPRYFIPSLHLRIISSNRFENCSHHLLSNAFLRLFV